MRSPLIYNSNNEYLWLSIESQQNGAEKLKFRSVKQVKDGFILGLGLSEINFLSTSTDLDIRRV